MIRPLGLAPHPINTEEELATDKRGFTQIFSAFIGGEKNISINRPPLKNKKHATACFFPYPRFSTTQNRRL